MACENLPIYRKAVKLVVYLEKTGPRFSPVPLSWVERRVCADETYALWMCKYAVGADLRNLARELAVLIVAANPLRDKGAHFTALRDKSEEMKFYGDDRQGGQGLPELICS